MSKTILLVPQFVIVSHFVAGSPEIHFIVDLGSEHTIAWRGTDGNVHRVYSWHGHRE